MKNRFKGYILVLGGLLIIIGVLVLYGHLWGLAIMAAGGMLMAPLWWPALRVSLSSNSNSPFLPTFWKAGRRGRYR